MNLASYRTLGRSGLIVSPLCLGTMTMGMQRWGSTDEVSAAIFQAYIEAGGNFIDTADVYSATQSESLIGRFIAEQSLRDRVVLATKFAWSGQKGNPLASGNGRKNITRALEGSLRRLQTDYIDLYWLHVWDGVTPAEEVLQTLGDLVRAGKIRYFGLSNIPAWYASRAVTFAEARGVPGPIALQLEYSLTERTIEREFVPLAQAVGLGITPWSPLAFGFLAGKYTRDENGEPQTGGGRLDLKDTAFKKFTERNWQILETLRAVSAEVDRSPAQVALSWALARPGMTSLIIGASREEQLRDNLAALDLALTPEQTARLDEASVPEPSNPHAMFTTAMRRSIFAGADVRGWC